MAKLYLGLGTNLGDKEKNLRDAVRKIEDRIGKVISLSTFYATEPWGFESTNSFLNAAACVETNLSPRDILNITQQIEQEMGRKSKTTHHSYTDRIIDVDLLMYDNLVMDEPDLTLPHPLMHRRRFVMEPLTEIAGEVMHPVLGKKIRDLYLSL